MRKHRLVTMLSSFLGPEVRSSQNIGWPIRIEELHNHSKTLKYHSKMARNTINLKTGRLLNAISSFIVLVEDSVSFLVKRRVMIHKVRPKKQLDNKRLE